MAQFNIATPLTWGESNTEFITAGYINGYAFTWGDTFIGEEAIKHAKTAEELNSWADKDEKKKKRVIELICRIKGEFFNEIKNVKDIKLTVKDVKLLYKEMQKATIKVQTKLENTNE